MQEFDHVSFSLRGQFDNFALHVFIHIAKLLTVKAVSIS